MPTILQILFLVSLAILPSLIWLGYYLRRDDRPEPRSRLMISFAIGVLITLLAAFLEGALAKISPKNNILLSTVIFFFAFPFIEELSKFIATLISNIKNRYFGDEYTDPMIYSITAALGFAAAENLKVCLSILQENSIVLKMPLLANLTIPSLVLNTLVITIFIRFLSAVFLHANASSVYGYFWGISLILKKDRKTKFLLIAFGIIMATLLHSFYNYLIMKTSENLYFALMVIGFLFITNYIMGRGFKQLKSYQQ